jgi:hypothetical protein
VNLSSYVGDLRKLRLEILFAGFVQTKLPDGGFMFLHEPSLSVLLLCACCHVLVPALLHGIHPAAKSDVEFFRSVSYSVRVCDAQNSIRFRLYLHSLHVAGK